jgi:hypothetical protein
MSSVSPEYVMCRPSRFAPLALILTSFWLAIPAHALELKAQTIKLEHPANGSVLRLQGQPVLLVSGHNHEFRWLSKVDYASGATEQIALPAQVQFFQQANLVGQAGSQLVALGQDAIWQYQFSDKKWRNLAQVSSAYPVTDAKRMLMLDFSVDLNQDGLSDFIVPDFRAVHVLMQQKDGKFTQFSLPITAQLEVFKADPSFELKKPRQMDFTLDGRTDIVFNVDDSLWVYPQQADGSFATTATVVPLGLGLTPDTQAQQRGGDGRSYENLTITRLERLMDLNGDKVADLVVQQQHYVDVMEQKYNYRIHYGRNEQGKLVFAQKADQQINTTGVQFDVQFTDLDADGRLDFYTPAADIGISKIVSALLTGSASVDWLFYKQQADGSFGVKPVHQQEVDVGISLGSGQFNLPVTAVLKGADGKATLLKADGDETLRSYAPVGAKLFSDKSSKQQINLPKRAINLLVRDLNDDGKEDLVLPFGAQEAKGQTNQITILLQ